MTSILFWPAPAWRRPAWAMPASSATLKGSDLVGVQLRAALQSARATAWNGGAFRPAGTRSSPVIRPKPPSRTSAYRVIATDFVTMEDGTGIVHVAPAFGEVDFEAGQR